MISQLHRHLEAWVIWTIKSNFVEGCGVAHKIYLDNLFLPISMFLVGQILPPVCTFGLVSAKNTKPCDTENGATDICVSMKAYKNQPLLEAIETNDL